MRAIFIILAILFAVAPPTSAQSDDAFTKYIEETVLIRGVAAFSAATAHCANSDVDWNMFGAGSREALSSISGYGNIND